MTDIDAGTEWEKEIHRRLNTSHVILLLVSPDFMAFEYCYSTEMTQAMKRHESGEAQVIPNPYRLTSVNSNVIRLLYKVTHSFSESSNLRTSLIIGYRKTN
ncbi:hypothetical protein KSF_011800 [Reticulibacter mediterranei]|uniref:TIR domain-containing protein n=1 Tax=Reticulibacter mediterranei TaxID=2778369 RepID=A0A8J3MYS1_9CHLR|nr:hypothetical protein KSF_011800 [Reticulibacter mediterranei]